ncbi:hypothetical protein [Myroides marinus]
MWLSGMSYPDHNTINRFRSSKLKDYYDKTKSKLITFSVILC